MPPLAGSGLRGLLGPGETPIRWAVALSMLIIGLLVLTLDVVQPSGTMCIGYLAPVLLSVRLGSPRAPLFGGIAAVALALLAPPVSGAGWGSVSPLGRGLASLALLACGSICYLRLRASHALRIFTRVARNIEAPLTILDAAGRVTFWNDGAQSLYGLARSEAMGLRGVDLYPRDVQLPAVSCIEQSLASGEIQTFDTTRISKSCKRIDVEETILPIAGDKGQTLAVALIDSDRSAAREREEAAHRLAHFDTLTSLPNRSSFQQKLEDALELARRHKRMAAVLFLDLDGFKHVNDAFGHQAGDELLCLVAERLMGSLRRTDYVGRGTEPQAETVISRLGGDEFTVILTDIASSSDAALTAKRMLDSLTRPMRLGDHETVVTASTGIAVYPDDGTDTATLLRNADTAMYKAKARGPGQYAFYSDDMNRELKRRLAVASAVRRAIQEERLELHFQPQVRLRDGVFVAAEALLRIDDPELGKLSPTEFIPIAEESGLIGALGEWVLCAACREAASWQGDGAPLRIAVNVSTHQLRVENTLAAMVETALERSGLAPSLLELEITESAIMEDMEQPIEMLARLRQAGVRVVLDDFGTGYSSLGRLLHLPLDGIKVDRSFLEGIHRSPREAALVRAIIGMAKSLALNVVAEGVETSTQLDFLREYACDEVQGFLVSHPLPAPDFLERLHRPVWPEDKAVERADG